ncbi:MAG: bifunctional folylpolyglutamate synthase/dihydrofolate synthase [Chloroflexi bacterium]|nr:bifunctional folylpolyglutamate synthase/dihydrofolate synthase [Chloroflexota bacterium]
MGEREALAWLYSLADQERGVGWNPRASPDSQWKLGRTRALLDLAGGPDRTLRIALVAGTKGKGSTSAMLASILAAAGARSGLYSKPHLQSYRERVRVDGAAISPSDFTSAVERIRGCVSDLERLHPDAGEPTTFEVTTAMALDFFARQKCSMAVVEVGLGGRLDATNATDPFVSIVTSISYDHTAILGRTLGEIATEKAGILRPRRPGFIAQQRPAAAAALRRACRQVGACCTTVSPIDRDVPLAGAHQRQNAALAIEAARVLGVSDMRAVERGLRQLQWPGRFEVVADGHFILDGAHNGASAEALARTIPKTMQLALVIGINRDKDARAVLRPLLPLASQVWATETSDNPRALPASALAGLCRRLGRSAHVEPDLARALQAAAKSAALVCVTGSLMLVGQARATLGLPVPERLW